VLFEAYPSGGTYVRVLENGVPSPTAWYASVGPQFYTTTANNLSLLLPTGSYPVASVGIPLPIGGKELVPDEQLGPWVASPTYVSGRYTNLTIDFHDQWRVNVTAFPSEGGTVQPQVGWWNDSEPLNLTATAALGYAFQGWSGWGPGSYNGTDRSITVVPTGRLLEKARFGVGTEVILWESGLPTGTPWSVTIRGITSNSTSNLITVYELPGSYGFSVTPILGYRCLPWNGGFLVGEASELVQVQFIALTPPPPSFPVTFRVSGLPASTSMSITVRGQTEHAGVNDPQFQLLNGSYAYRVGFISGYHANVPGKTFVVRGGPLTIDVPFVQTVYPVTWQAIGTRVWMNWTVWIDGQASAATSAWVSTRLPNGSYPYAVDVPSNYSASPRAGIFRVDGSATQVTLWFTVVQFPLRFDASGLAAHSAWSIRFGNLTQGASTSGSSFYAENGTYTFNVHPPDGYYAVPSHGTVTVAGESPPMKIEFHLSSNRPSAALVAELTAGAISTSIWLGASILVGFVAFRGLRRRGGRRH
ncbi:MAG TPA: hypothetical protein VIZ68_07580, partial [Thermoplasmata archaeon]